MSHLEKGKVNLLDSSFSPCFLAMEGLFFYLASQERERERERVISAKVICWCKCNFVTNRAQGHIEN